MYASASAVHRQPHPQILTFEIRSILLATTATRTLSQLFITAPIMATIKDEPIDVPEGLVPRTPTQVPLGFERDEWEKLTEVIIIVNYNSLC